MLVILLFFASASLFLLTRAGHPGHALHRAPNGLVRTFAEPATSPASPGRFRIHCARLPDCHARAIRLCPGGYDTRSPDGLIYALRGGTGRVRFRVSSLAAQRIGVACHDQQ